MCFKVRTFWETHKILTNLPYDFHKSADLLKGQLISKANWRAIDSPKKQTDEFDLFAVKSKKANKTNSSAHFLGESMARQSAFEINWLLPSTNFFKKLFFLAQKIV